VLLLVVVVVMSRAAVMQVTVGRATMTGLGLCAAVDGV